MDYIDALSPYLVSTNNEVPNYVVAQDVEFSMDGSYYFACPGEGLSISVLISYPNRWVKSQMVHYLHSEKNYRDQIAPARTYGFEDEVKALIEQQLAQGGGLDNALVVGESDYLNSPRFPDEMARHKLLDFIGDMAIGNRRYCGQFVIVKPSHRANVSFLKHLIDTNV